MSANGKYQLATNFIAGASLYRSYDYGVTWAATTAPSAQWRPNAISATGQYQIAGVWVGGFYTSNNYGVTWTQNTTVSGNRYWLAAAISASGKYQAIQDCSGDVVSGYIYNSSDYGVTFTANTSAGKLGWGWISMSANGQYQAAVSGAGGVVNYPYISRDFGVTFTPNTSIGQSNWTSISMSANGQNMATCAGFGYIYTSIDYGVTWSQKLSIGYKFWSNVLLSANSQYMIANDSSNNIYRSITPYNDTVANFVTVNNSINPLTTNSINVGGAANLWSTVYANSGTITSSDQRLKTNITPSNLGTNFISQLNPVSYKWLEGANVPNEDSTVTIRPGKRRFYGFLAQDVKQTLDDLSVNDFAGWVLTDTANPDSAQGLRYTEFVSPIIKSIQEINTDLSTTLASIHDLSANIHSLYTQTQT